MAEQGFFFPSHPAGKPPPINVVGCGPCSLFLHCKSPRMKYSGQGKKRILVVGTYPDQDEDRKGTHFIGRQGIYIRRLFERAGLDMEVDCWKTYAVNCAPGLNSKGEQESPKQNEVSSCRPRLKQLIKELAPKVVILLGNTAIESLIGLYWKKEIYPARWYHQTIPDQILGAWICPIFHPEFLLDWADNPVAEAMVDKDLRIAAKLINRPIPKYDPWGAVKVVTSDPEAVQELNKVLDNPPEFLAFDYETTGIRPYNQGHDILYTSYSTDGKSAICFINRGEARGLYCRILSHDKIKKIAHNMKFEDTWSRVILKTPPDPWDFDTSMAAHVLDNRKQITSLKFQAYIHFGIADYDSNIEQYLDEVDDSGFNKIRLAPIIDVMQYCGMDSLFTYNLANIQKRKMELI